MIIKYSDLGWEFDTEENTFSIGDDHVFFIELTTQELADMLSFAHAKKVEKDNEIKKQYADKGNNN